MELVRSGYVESHDNHIIVFCFLKQYSTKFNSHGPGFDSILMTQGSIQFDSQDPGFSLIQYSLPRIQITSHDQGFDSILMTQASIQFNSHAIYIQFSCNSILFSYFISFEICFVAHKVTVFVYTYLLI